MHLTSEQIENTLSGQSSEETARHLGECARCAGELAALREVFGDLREATAASAEFHQRFAPALAARAAERRPPRMVWGLVTAALFAGAVTPLAMHYRDAIRTTPGATPKSANATISDEALLDGVQNDLSTSVPASMLPLAGTSTSMTDAADTTVAQRTNQ